MKRIGSFRVATLVVFASLALSCSQREASPTAADVLAAAATPTGELEITYPADDTLFPPDIVAPTVVWNDSSPDVDRWLVAVGLGGEFEPILAATAEASWRPSEADWATVKRASTTDDAEIAVVGIDDNARGEIVSSARIRIRTSEDEVRDSIFYREVPLPFLSAVRDPSRIRWRFGQVNSEARPPIVLEDLPVCGNCHSFSSKGTVLGLDVDYGNDKGAYAVMSVQEQMVMDESNIITWADYKRDDDEVTFGLLSQVSPDGRYVVSTVKDRSVFVATPDIEFSQLFFPIKGILVVYDRQEKTFRPLAGADDSRYVQSNPSWSPDGKHIVFARAEAYDVAAAKNKDSVLLDENDVPEFVTGGTKFRYDLYRVPFNDGAGGTAEPLEGASANGKSNFFAKYSPDGKWIVFCQADSYMLLQPDSELYIVPAAGGPARRLAHNTRRMNSWHSWSSNSRWLVFSSKVNTPYTQLFLTHIDEDGNDTPPVLLERFTATDRAANIPEFVDLPADAITRIREGFLDTYSFLRAGMANQRTGDLEGAQRSYRRGLEIEPEDPELRNALGWSLFQQGDSNAAVVEYRRALAADPDYVKAHNNIALALIELGQADEAIQHFKQSVELEPAADILSDLGFVLDRQGETDEAMEYYERAIEIDPKVSSAHLNLAAALTRTGEFDRAISHYREAVELDPDAHALNGLGVALARQGRVDEAIEQFEAAIAADATFAPVYENLATNLEKRGRLADAVPYYRAILAEAPSADLHNDLGVILLKLGDRRGARQQFAEAVRIDPDHPIASRNFAALQKGQKERGK